MMTTRVEKQVGVYEPCTASAMPPDFYTSEMEARRMCADGEASRINHGKAIRIRRDATVLRMGSAECNTEWVEKWYGVQA